MKKLLALLFLAFGLAHAQQHTLKFILSSGPGFGSDVTLETYSPCLRNQHINVLKEYKPGAEGLVAIKALHQSQDTDNVTNILLGNFGLNVLGKFPNVDLLTDINPITYMNSTPLVFVTKAGKYKSLDELIADPKGRPLNIGSPSASGSFLTEIIFKDLNVQFQIIPYKSSVAGLSDVVNENLDLFVDTYIGARPLIEANRIQIMTSTFDKQTASKLNHSNMLAYSSKLSRTPISLGLILSVNPSLNKESRDIIVKAIHTCGKDTSVIQKLENNMSQPVFLSTNDIIRMVKQFSGK